MLKKLPTKLILKLVSLALIIILIIWVNGLDLSGLNISEEARNWGYLGVLIASIISGFNVLVPIPIATFVPTFIEIGLNPIISIVIISIGMTVGDGVGFFIGKTGSEVVNIENNKLYKKLKHLQERYPKLPIFILFIYASFAPIPNEIIVIPMAFLGYKFHHMMISVTFGNIIFNTLIAYGATIFFT